MSEYASRNEIDQMLGLTSKKETSKDLKGASTQVIEPEPDSNPPEDKVTEIVVPEDRLEKVADKPDSTPEPSDTDEEVNGLKSKVRELEEKQQRDTQGIKEIVAELQGQIRASPAVIQSEQILDTLEKLQHRFNELVAGIEAASCPECGALVGWNSQVREIPQREFDEAQAKVNERPAWAFSRLFDFDAMFGKPPMVKVRQCAACGHTEKVEEVEETEEAKEPASEEKMEAKASKDNKRLFPFKFGEAKKEGE